ncbi:citrate synthase [Proteobacteria bacterium 005FR1]|nr:citrate synthase [Proteobacteria bacterium 005FR1]
MSDLEPLPASRKFTVSRRPEKFADRITTRIWLEEPSSENPYVAKASYCHGYNILELASKRSFSDVIYLLFRGELPNEHEAELFASLMVSFINPGPRHAATRAAMNAGVGKTDPSNILPVALSIFGGEHLGSGEVEPALRWLRKNLKKSPQDLARELLHTVGSSDREGDFHVAPGFGSFYGSIDEMSSAIAEQLLRLPAAGPVMKWAAEFSKILNTAQMGWLSTGVVAATLADLGFQPRVAPGIFQIMSAPGLFAHGIELASKPLTAMPFPGAATTSSRSRRNEG